MAEKDDNFSGEMTRVPTREDIVQICSALNEQNAKYIVVGGVAIIEMGLMRSTMDVDLLVDANSSNVTVVCNALAFLPDRASQEVQPEDVQNYTVVRINDEFTIDLMGSACGITYEEALRDVEWKELDGVKIPFASPQLLWKTKQTYREKDALDRSFLRKWFADHGVEPPPTGI